MSFKSLLTHVVNDRGCAARLRMTASVARVLGAEVIGLGARESLADSKIELDAAQGIIDAAGKRFRDQLSDAAISVTWREEFDFPDTALIKHARAADLIVTYRAPWIADPWIVGPGSYAPPDTLVMESGLPVLLLPRREADFRADTILLGWKNTREARRAIAMTLPLLRAARRVLVATVCGKREIEPVEQELADVARLLGLHGVTATTLAEVGAPGSAGRKLLRIAQTDKSDLIVAGGYGHSRLREWMMGGVTRDLIADRWRYVLLVH